MKKILMLAGEPSGDLHGSLLAIELKNASPEIEILGTGGDKMKAAGVNCLFDLKDLAVTGLIDVIKKYSHFKKIQRTLLSYAQNLPLPSGERAGVRGQIDLIILIDYPDFNLRFARLAHRFGVPIIYYISPQVWAWRKGRIKVIKKYVKKIFVIFKFEEEIYKKAGVPVEFIGHPLLDIVKPGTVEWGQFSLRTVPISGQTIALLPGSRKRLIRTLLPIMLKSCEIIHKRFPQMSFLISKIPSVQTEQYENILSKFALPVKLVEGEPYDVINAADLVLTVSGTSTLETAILGKPMVIIYKLPLLEYLLAKSLIRLKNISLVNIVAGEEVVPEFVQFRARPKKIAEYAVEILSDKARYKGVENKLTAVKNALYPGGGAQKAAASILTFLNHHD